MVSVYEKKNSFSFTRWLFSLVRINETFDEWVARTNPTCLNYETAQFEYTEEKAKQMYQLGGIKSRQNQWFIFRMLEYGDPRLKETVIYGQNQEEYCE